MTFKRKHKFSVGDYVVVSREKIRKVNAVGGITLQMLMYSGCIARVVDCRILHHRRCYVLNLDKSIVWDERILDKATDVDIRQNMANIICTELRETIGGFTQQCQELTETLKGQETND